MQSLGEPRSIIYSDGSVHPVKIPYPAWTSARVLGDIVHILISEVMGYNAVLLHVDTVFDQDIVGLAAGCQDVNCDQIDIENPEIHFTLETSNLGASRALVLPAELRPELLAVLSYDLFDQWYIWLDVVEAGLNSDSHVSLDYYRSYDAQIFSPHVFFDEYERVLGLLPTNVTVRCSAMVGSRLRNTEQYSRATNDTGVDCQDDLVWISPACRSNHSLCIPLMVQYNFEVAMQQAFFLRMPLAIFMVGAGPHGDYREYFAAIRASRCLFGWYQPDDSLVDSAGRFPTPLILPFINQQEQREGIFKTGFAVVSYPRSFQGAHVVFPTGALSSWPWPGMCFRQSAGFSQGCIHSPSIRTEPVQATRIGPAHGHMHAARRRLTGAAAPGPAPISRLAPSQVQTRNYAWRNLQQVPLPSRNAV